ncbi:MAG TPA: hypothetical protein VNY36_07280 [Bacteroidia bacterium]|jgi:hypothetical protein|nr:hypothetical protein [Bacteroidia bacterium]
MKELKWYGLFFIAVLGFLWIIGFNGLYGQDSYEYLRYTKCLNEFFKSGTNPGDYFWPVLYPLIGSVLSFAIPLPFALQLISTLSLLFAAIYLEKIILLIFRVEKIWVRLHVFLFFLLSPYMLRASLVVMSDSLSIFFVVAAWYYFEEYKRSVTSKSFLLFVFFFAAAITTRYAAFIVLFVPAVVMGIKFFRNFKFLNFLAAICIVAVLCIPHFLIRKLNPLGFLSHEWVMSWSPLNFFRSQFDTRDGIEKYSYYNLLYAFFNLMHPAFCFADLLLLGIVYKVRKQIKGFGLLPILLSTLLYGLFLAGIPFQNMRFLLLSFPLALIVLFAGYNELRQYLVRRKLQVYGVVIVLIIQIGLFYRVFIPFYNDSKTEKQVSVGMSKYANATLYTFSIDMALKSYGYKGNIINMSQIKMDTLKNKDTNALVLFNVKQFSEEYKNKNPMINWEYLNNNYALVKIDDMPEGWVLYKLHFDFQKK